MRSVSMFPFFKWKSEYKEKRCELAPVSHLKINQMLSRPKISESTDQIYKNVLSSLIPYWDPSWQRAHYG